MKHEKECQLNLFEGGCSCYTIQLARGLNAGVEKAFKDVLDKEPTIWTGHTPTYEKCGVVLAADFRLSDGTRVCRECWQARPENKKETVRQFDTGATRSPIGEKLCYAGFNDSRVEKRYAEYMSKHRVQDDGTLRAPDNWKRGIPLESYHDSMARHFKDIELYMQGYESEMSEDIVTAMCAMKFNVNGMLFEILKKGL